jgi:hypothetical protein
LHSGDSAVAGDYPVLTRGDTVAPRGVMGAVRFMLKAADRGVTLDSGLVAVASAGGRIDAHAHGSGLEPGAGQRVVLDASFHAVPVATDTVTCRVRLQP